MFCSYVSYLSFPLERTENRTNREGKGQQRKRKRSPYNDILSMGLGRAGFEVKIRPFYLLQDDYILYFIWTESLNTLEAADRNQCRRPPNQRKGTQTGEHWTRGPGAN